MPKDLTYDERIVAAEQALEVARDVAKGKNATFAQQHIHLSQAVDLVETLKAAKRASLVSSVED